MKLIVSEAEVSEILGYEHKGDVTLETPLVHTGEGKDGMAYWGTSSGFSMVKIGPIDVRVSARAAKVYERKLTKVELAAKVLDLERRLAERTAQLLAVTPGPAEAPNTAGK